MGRVLDLPRICGVGALLAGVVALGVAARIAFAESNGLCEEHALAKPKLQVLAPGPLPDDPDDWRPWDPNDPQMGIWCETVYCNESCEPDESIVGVDPQNPQEVTYLIRCLCTDEEQSWHGDHVGGDSDLDCTLAVKYNQNQIDGSRTFLAYLCVGVCAGSQNCEVQGDGIESWNNGVLVYAGIICECQ